MTTCFRCLCIAVALSTSLSLVWLLMQIVFIGTPITFSESTVLTDLSISESNSLTVPHTFIVTVRFGGQQGAGLLALVSQQCFISDLGIHAYIVEPFLDDSVLYHTDLKTTDSRNKLKFSDLFNLDTFNRESQKLGYEPIVRLEYFLNQVPDKAIIVELQSGGKKGTEVLWDGYNTLASPCHQGRRKHLMNSITVCVVRMVSICCVNSLNLAALSHPNTILTTQELHNAIFGNWGSDHMNVIFQHWTAFWRIPKTCKCSLAGKIDASEQVWNYANKYRDTFLKSNKVVAFVLRFEKLILRNYNIDVCLRKFHQAREDLKSILTNASVFVTADIGRYQSGSWETTYSEAELDHKRGEQIKSRFMNALSDFLISSQWKFDEWENSFDQVTGGIEDAGYIATLQKSIASTSDCLVFLMEGESSFQDMIKQEYFKLHPTVSERCIHYLCTKDCPNCTHFYTKQLFK